MLKYQHSSVAKNSTNKFHIFYHFSFRRRYTE